MTDQELDRSLEALLFVAERPVSLTDLATATGTMIPAIQQGVLRLSEYYQSRGLRLICKGDFVQLVTAPELAPVVQRFFRRELRAELTRAALETLAIVAYREPITRGEIEQLRGVSSENTLRTLLIRGLIREVGRADSLGRPILYGTTLEFLQHFGLEKSEDLPPLPTLPLGDSETQPIDTSLFSQS